MRIVFGAMSIATPELLANTCLLALEDEELNTEDQ
jgi:hypothetical protein